MRLLLDTHTFLWAITDDPKLGPASRELITHQAGAVLFSHVSLWERDRHQARPGPCRHAPVGP